MGSRYSLEPLKAQFTGLTQETTREEMLAALVRGLCEYQRSHLEDMGRQITLTDTIHVTGGAVNDALIRAKKRWMHDCRYRHQEQSSLKGAAMLGRRFHEISRTGGGGAAGPPG
jgi:sugar (pentulose or hexulose) kinase